MDWHWLAINIISPTQVEAWFEWGGYFILFALLFACGLGLPLPEDIPLLLAGYFIADGKMHWLHAGIVAWLGIIGGDCMLYSFGRRYGLNITRVPFIGKHVTKERILRAEELFDAWGVWVVGFGRMVAGIRGAMVVAAGATRFNFVKFLIADGIAALFSGGIFVALGYWAGVKLGSVEAMRAKIKGIEHWVIIGGVLVVLFALLFIIRRNRQQKPKPTDVALNKLAEKAHQHQAAKQGDTANDPPPAG